MAYGQNACSCDALSVNFCNDKSAASQYNVEAAHENHLSVRGGSVLHTNRKINKEWVSIKCIVLKCKSTHFNPVWTETSFMLSTTLLCYIETLQIWKESHEELLLKSDLPPLSKRRDIATLCHLFKIVHGLCSSTNPFKLHPRPNLRNFNSCALDPLFCRLTLSQRSFHPYAITLWNYLQ